MTCLSQNNTLSIHHPVLLWGKSFTFVLQMKNIRKICHTHPKSKGPKVSALRTHLYPSRFENPVGFWMKAQLQLRRNVHLKRTISEIIPHVQIRVPSCCQQKCVKGFERRRARESEPDPGAWCLTVLVMVLCRLETELRTGRLSCIHCGRGMTGFLQSNDTGLYWLNNCVDLIPLVLCTNRMHFSVQHRIYTQSVQQQRK